MSGERHHSKNQKNIGMPIDLLVRVEKKAKMMCMDVSKWIVSVLYAATSDVELTPEELQKISDEEKKNERDQARGRKDR